MTPPATPPPRLRRRLLGGLFGAGVAAAAAVVWFGFTRSTRPPDEAPPPSRAAAMAQRVQGALRLSTAAASTSGQPPTPASAPGLAVLPFEAPPGDATLAALAGSMCEALAEHLGRGELPAASACTSVRLASQIGLTPAEIAQLLGVRALLAGRVDRDGERVRVSARLLGAEAGTARVERELWRHEASHEPRRLAELPVHLVRRIAEHERGAGRGAAGGAGLPVPAGDAYVLYLQALQAQRAGGAESLQRARALLDQALALAPDHPPMLLASVALNSQLVALGVGSGAAVDAQVRETAAQLQRVDPEGPQCAQLVAAADAGRRRWQTAFETLEAAARRHPGHAPLLHTRSGILLMMGYLARGRESALRSAMIEPLNASVHERLARAASLLGDDAALRGSAALTRELGRANMAAAYEAWAALRSGNAAQAELHWRELLGAAKMPQDWIAAVLRAHTAPADASARAAAVAALDALPADVRARQNHGFLGYALAGDVERAMLALERTHGDVPTMWMSDLWLPELAALRRHPRFVPYLRDAGLLALWQAHGAPERCRRGSADGAWRCD